MVKMLIFQRIHPPFLFPRPPWTWRAPNEETTCGMAR